MTCLTMKAWEYGEWIDKPDESAEELTIGELYQCMKDGWLVESVDEVWAAG